MFKKCSECKNQAFACLAMRKRVLLKDYKLTKQISKTCVKFFNLMITLNDVYRRILYDSNVVEEITLNTYIISFNKKLTTARRIIKRLKNIFKLILFNVDIIIVKKINVLS